MSCTYTLSCVSVLANTVAECASWLAFTNTWKDRLPSWRNAYCGIHNSFSQWSCCNQLLKSAFTFSGTSSSQLILYDQSFCNNSLGFKDIGEDTPMGSKIRWATDNIFLFVTCDVVRNSNHAGVNFKVSCSLSQSKPSMEVNLCVSS